MLPVAPGSLYWFFLLFIVILQAIESIAWSITMNRRKNQGQMITDVIRWILLHRWLLLFTGEKVSSGFKTRQTRRVVSFHVVAVVKSDTQPASLRHCLVAATAGYVCPCLCVGPREILRQCIDVMYRIGCEICSLAQHWYQQWSRLQATNQFLIKSLYVALTTRSALQWLCDPPARSPHYAVHYFVCPSIPVAL